MSTTLTLVFAIAYFIVGFLIAKFLSVTIPRNNKYFRIVILSFVYSVLFGIGILAIGDGHDGFAVPFPIMWAGAIYIWKWSEWSLFTKGVILPLFSWWAVIFTIMAFKQSKVRQT
jgi:hypothetical protein